jgi:polyferredoxin
VEWIKERKIKDLIRPVLIIIPIIILVSVLAMWMLNNNNEFSEIEFGIKLLISVGAGILSGIISYFLFAFEKNK